ncbi:hypothetical protein SH601_10580 [Gracilibacillus sp. S3-1-1]|uniref:Uncharacterized protein n=1 Tax=Gracilibacillus pellucidus TaxID=3095368 RepID=A0ACC6M6G0_9BACI|nr:hypothetical protein [Gracilibacillus sp. S3-1-1]MDX8046427.1 hypothetical protein [Gracilibacillus sp. S3-1-1]
MDVDVVLTFIGLAVNMLIAFVNLTTAIVNFKKHKKKDRRSAKRRSE